MRWKKRQSLLQQSKATAPNEDEERFPLIAKQWIEALNEGPRTASGDSRNKHMVPGKAVPAAMLAQMIQQALPKFFGHVTSPDKQAASTLEVTAPCRLAYGR